jgi:hypothetical protein
MAVNITRTSSTPGTQDAASLFRQHVEARVFDHYCSSEEYRAIAQYGVETAGFEPRKVENALDLELERLGAANEVRLLLELESALSRFTSSDRKLSPKEKKDALQLVCKSRPGFRFGLKPEVAEAAILAYCRKNSVKVKTGILSWAVP